MVELAVCNDTHASCMVFAGEPRSQEFQELPNGRDESFDQEDHHSRSRCVLFPNIAFCFLGFLAP
jgi:hypothetical protein